MSATFSACCLKGNLHSGETVGKIEKVFGVDTYVTGKASDRTLVIFSDIFGIGLQNNLLIADRLADAGYRVYIPDLFDGDYVDAELMAKGFDMEVFMAWKKRHGLDVTSKITHGFLQSLRAEVGQKFVGVIAHCFGAPFALDELTKDGLADAGAIAHPSQLTEDSFKTVAKPVLLSCAQVDNSFPLELRQAAEKILIENNARFELTLFSGVPHGFAVRGDLSNPLVKYAKEKVLSDQIVWFSQF